MKENGARSSSITQGLKNRRISCRQFFRLGKDVFSPVLAADHVRLFHSGVLYRLFFPESFQRNADGKDGFPVWDAGDGDGSVVGFHGAFYNGEAQARSLISEEWWASTR